jgi:tetratricopeptide (TPR) repeat protein
MRQLFDTALQLHRQGQLGQAETQYRQILRQLPHQADVLNALGMLLTQRDKAEEAIPLFRQAIKADGNAAHIYLNLGEALRATGRHKEAASAFRRALQIRPNYPEAQFCQGNLLHDQHRLSEAIACYRRTIHAMPQFVPALNSLGVALQESGQLDDAVAALLSAIRLQPDYADAHFNLANSYFKLEKDSLAATHYRHCLRLQPDNAMAHCCLAEVLMNQVVGSDAEIEAHFNAAAKTLSDSPVFLRALGVFSARQGNNAAALELLKKSIETEVAALPIFDYAHAIKFKTEEPWLIQKAQNLLASGSLDAEGQGLVQFALGKMQDDIGCYDQAFEHFRKANAAIRNTKTYDRQQEEQWFSRLQNFFTAEFLHGFHNENFNGQQLVFILGMPRSGTTLTEQIISSHPRVQGGGELGVDGIKDGLINHYGGAKAFPNLLADMSEETLRQTVDAYLDELGRLFPGNYARLTDKMPHNFLYVGLIALLFPKASIIHVKREPMDNCLSIYFQKFLRDHPYAYDLADIGHQYLLYRNLMAHWHSVLPGRILDLNYEDLIAAPEFWTRKLIDHVGLEWDEACLAPHKLERSVKTASHWQVRQPIYKSSVQRWKNYEKHLALLKEALGYQETNSD